MIQPFDLIFYKGDSIISRFIRHETNSMYSHVALGLDDKHIVEIDKNYNLRINHIAYNTAHFDVYRLKESISPEQQQIIIKYIYKTLNSKYDFIEAIDIFLYKIFKGSIKHSSYKFVCSGWINSCYRTIGQVLSDKDLVSPQDLISDKIYKIN